MLFPLPASAAGLFLTLEAPYSLTGGQLTAAPGQRIHAMVNIENTGPAGRNVVVRLELPAGFRADGNPEHWTVGQSESAPGQVLQRELTLPAGYGQWFDLVSLTVDSQAMEGAYSLRLSAGETTREIRVKVSPRVDGVSVQEKPALERVVLPLDRDGVRDEKQNANTLVLRDRSLDYYKNVLRGKGATNLEIEAIHPLTHMGLDFRNPAGQQKLLMVEAELLDKNSRRRVPGLYTPGSNSEHDGAGAMAAGQERLTAFVALTGEPRQRLILPVYADETQIAEGDYLLRVTVDDGGIHSWSQELPLVVIEKNMRGMVALSIGVTMLLAFLVLIRRKLPQVLAGMKTRRLITIALFGTCAFAVVNVPSTLLNDFLHIFLGPFSFLISGMFSGIMLYMLTGALVTLIPLHGVVSLMAAMRLLLGMLAFGHMSPLVFLSYGVNAFLLELALAGTGFTAASLTTNPVAGFSWQRMAMLALACAVADTVATYITMQGMAVLYRLYFADWYIWMVMAVNGFLYTVIGAACGAVLGSRLSGVGSD
jgi:hypothetical protein